MSYRLKNAEQQYVKGEVEALVAANPSLAPAKDEVAHTLGFLVGNNCEWIEAAYKGKLKANDINGVSETFIDARISCCKVELPDGTEMTKRGFDKAIDKITQVLRQQQESDPLATSKSEAPTMG